MQNPKKNKKKNTRKARLNGMSTIAFINGKGGCGKSTSIYHLSGILASKNESVLVLDFDKQGNTTSTLLCYTEKPKKSVYDVMIEKAEPEDAVAKALFKSRESANPKYYGVKCMAADEILEREDKLAKVDGEAFAKKIKDYIAKEQFDWVFIDMPPSNKRLNEICFNYLTEYVIVPFSADTYSVSGYGSIIRDINDARQNNPSLSILGVYLSRYNARFSLDVGIKEQLEDALGDTFLPVTIPYTADIATAAADGRVLGFYRHNSASEKAYVALLEEMKKRL